MGGTRRISCALAIAVALTLAATGCSTISESVDLAVDGQSLGQQAVSANAPTATPTPSSGWSSAEPCTTVLKTGIESDLPAGTAIASVDPATISGPLSDPNLNVGDIATCAFTISSGSHRQIDEFFVGMPYTYYAQFATRLQADGFTLGATITLTDGGTEQLFTKAGDRVVLSYAASAGNLLTVFG